MWKCDFSAVLNEPTDSRARMCISIGSWFQALGPATANAQVLKCVTEEETTRSPRVADRSLCLLPTVVTGRQRSAMYDGASHCPCSALYVSRHSLNWTRCWTGSQWRRSRSTCLIWGSIFFEVWLARGKHVVGVATSFRVRVVFSPPFRKGSRLDRHKLRDLSGKN